MVKENRLIVKLNLPIINITAMKSVLFHHHMTITPTVSIISGRIVVILFIFIVIFTDNIAASINATITTVSYVS